jgi:hypothetical protein
VDGITPPPPLGKKVKVDADKAIRVPPPYCANASDPDVSMSTPEPSVIVVVAVPMFAMKIVSPAEKMSSSTVTVFAEPTFMMTRLPASEARSV